MALGESDLTPIGVHGKLFGLLFADNYYIGTILRWPKGSYSTSIAYPSARLSGACLQID